MKEKKTILVGAKIPQSLKKQLDAIAEKEERTISFIVFKAIEEYLQKRAGGN